MVATYKITDAAGVLAHRVVVRGANAGECQKPSAENEGKIVGVTREAQATQNKAVPVDTDGIVQVTAAGVIAYGDAVGIADSAGKVKSVQTAMATGLVNPASVLYVVGFAEEAAAADGDIIKMRLQPMVVALAVS